MAGVEIALIIIAVILLIGSFLIQEKLSPKDIEKIAELSETELKVIVDKQLASADEAVEHSIEEQTSVAMENTERSMEKLSNEKIMAISEFSDTIMDSMNKTHNEIMFLYSMLNDKHADLTKLAGQLQQFSDKVRSTEDEMMQKIADAAVGVENRIQYTAPVETVEEEPLPYEEETAEAEVNHNEYILRLHNQGESDVQIARALGLGLGEVKLVIGLFERGKQSEI